MLTLSPTDYYRVHTIARRRLGRGRYCVRVMDDHNAILAQTAVRRTEAQADADYREVMAELLSHPDCEGVTATSNDERLIEIEDLEDIDNV